MKPHVQSQSSKRTYTNLNDYATQQGVPEQAFIEANYQVLIHQGRLALQYPTDTGNRYRFLDGQEPRHRSPYDYKSCWYGLETAIEMATELNKPLVMVNGASGVIAAQYHGIAAFAVSDGESRAIPQNMLDELNRAWQGEIIIALDCDATGRQNAAKRARQLLDAGFIVRAVDLQLGDNGDIADFCKILGTGAFDQLLTLPEINPAAPKKAYCPPKDRVSLLNTDDDARRLASQWFDNNCAEVSWATSGRRNILLSAATKSGGLVKGGYITSAEAERGLMDAAATCGLIDKYSEREIARTIHDCFRAANATVIEPKPRQTDRRVSKSAQVEPEQITLRTPANLPAFTADKRFSSRYVSNAPIGVLDCACIAMKSPTGSGKSQWAAAATISAPTLLTIAFRTSLVKSQADLYEAVIYDALSGPDRHLITSANRVSTTIDSLHKFSNRVFDTIVIDEWVSLIGHFSSAGTLKEKAAGIWELLKRFIMTAKRVIVMDAMLTNESLAELKALRSDVVFIENSFIQPKASTQLLPNRTAFFIAVLQRIKVATLPVLIGVTTPAEARITKDWIEQIYPNKRIRTITSKQSHMADTQAFVRLINKRLKEKDVLIFNGAMSTGVSIDIAVDSIICLIGLLCHRLTACRCWDVLVTR